MNQIHFLSDKPATHDGIFRFSLGHFKNYLTAAWQQNPLICRGAVYRSKKKGGMCCRLMSLGVKLTPGFVAIN